MDVSLKALLLALTLALLTVAVRCSRVKDVLEVIAMRNCSNGPPVKNYIYNVSIVKERKDLIYARGDFKVEEPSSSRMKWKVLGYKCTERDALVEQEACEFYIKIDRNNMCTDIKMKNQVWSHLLDSSEPPFECPVAKGIYRLSKVRVDADEVKNMIAVIPHVHEFYWVSRLLVHKGNKPWACTEYVFKLVTVRV